MGFIVWVFEYCSCILLPTLQLSHISDWDNLDDVTLQWQDLTMLMLRTLALFSQADIVLLVVV